MRKIIPSVAIAILSIVFIKSAFGIECYVCQRQGDTCDGEQPPVIRKCKQPEDKDYRPACSVSRVDAKNGTDVTMRYCGHILESVHPPHCWRHFREEGNTTDCVCETDKCNWRTADEALSVTSVIEDKRYVQECFVCHGRDNNCDDEHPPVITKCDPKKEHLTACASRRVVAVNGTDATQKYCSYRWKDERPFVCRRHFTEEGNITWCVCQENNCNWRTVEEFLPISVKEDKHFKRLACYQCDGPGFTCDAKHPPYLRRCHDYDTKCRFIDEKAKSGAVTTRKFCGWYSPNKAPNLCKTYHNWKGNISDCTCHSDKCSWISGEEAVRSFVVEKHGYVEDGNWI